MKFRFFLYQIFISIISINAAHAQLSGYITNEKDEPLSFATVYIEGTSTGTTTNEEGYYQIDLNPGDLKISYRYVGYEQKTIDLTYDNQPMTRNVQLLPSVINIDEIVVVAGAEDPAYRIIREAIKKRKYYLTQLKSYSVNTYVKGNTKIANVPEKILGREIGDLEGVLDSNRQGIVYLSESQSKLHVQHPGQEKEIMVSSKVAGDDRGFGFNRAGDMDFDLYKNTIEFQRAIVSPIAENALAYYRYQLISATVDDKKHLVNKIKLIPKRKEDPCYEGHIYIIEDLWNIKEVDLLLTKKSLGIPIMDTLEIRQIHLPVKDPDYWKIFNQSIRFKFGFFGLKFEGKFTAIFSEYETDPQFSEGFFDKEVFYIDPTANQKDSLFWNDVRPIPLTLEEVKDYKKKDSLQILRKTKVYRDSVDKAVNQFKWTSLIFGYVYQKSMKNLFVSYASPLSTVGFNTVQGLNANLKFQIDQNFEDSTTYRKHDFTITPIFNYSFAEEKFRVSFDFTYRFNELNYDRLSIAGGEKVESFNSGTSLSPLDNTIYTLWQRKNFLKLYNRRFAEIGYGRNIIPALFSRIRFGYEERSPLINNSDYSFKKFRETREFTSNNPQDPLNDNPSFEAYNAFTFSFMAFIRIKPRYITYPGRRFYQGNDWPSLRIDFKSVKGVGSSKISSDLLTMSIFETSLSLGVIGDFNYFLRIGKFINKKEVGFMDRHFFDGNSLGYTNTQGGLLGFRLLKYYQFNTDDKFAEAHIEHNFRGYFLGKIPLLRKAAFELVTGVKAIWEPQIGNYYEINVGVDNLGFGIFRLLRLDYVWGFLDGDLFDHQLVVGIKL